MLASRFDAAPTQRDLCRLLFPLLPLTLWYGYHYARTGYVFGNPEFFRYNVAATLNPLRFVLALVLRLWQAFGYLHLWVLTVGMPLAMLLPPVKDGGIGTAAHRDSGADDFSRRCEGVRDRRWL